MLARDRLSLKQMSMILVKVFFGYGGVNTHLSTAASKLTMRGRSTNLGFVRAHDTYAWAFVTDVAELIGGQGIAQDVSPLGQAANMQSYLKSPGIAVKRLALAFSSLTR